jgi:hypothetical protein
MRSLTAANASFTPKSDGMNVLASSANQMRQIVAVAEQCTHSLILLVLNLSWRLMLVPEALKSFFVEAMVRAVASGGPRNMKHRT